MTHYKPLATLLLLAGMLPGVAGAQALDLSDPQQALRAMRKMQCWIEDGKPAVFGWNGSVWSRVPGEKDRKLFDYEAMSIRACKTFDDAERGTGYRSVSRELLVYLDPQSGEVLRSWTNPWTGEELEVVHIANDPVNFGPMYPQNRWGPFRFEADFREGLGWMSLQVPLFYDNPMGGDYQEYVGGTYQAIEMFNFFFPEDQLLDPTIGGVVDTHVAWSRMSKWLPWMKMGDRAGQMMYTGAGRRLSGLDGLPDLLLAEIDAHHPEYRQPPPLDDDRPNQTSWLYLKQRIDEARAAAAAEE
jgi:hypothetical protein